MDLSNAPELKKALQARGIVPPDPPPPPPPVGRTLPPLSKKFYFGALALMFAVPAALLVGLVLWLF
jgi:hypothetical protein